MTGDRHDPNQELMAQGVANFVAPFFGGIAATGTIARTVTNIRTGGRTPVAGIVHSVTLLAIVLVLAPLAGDIPMATLAAILLFVAWNMGDWAAFGRLRQFSNNYRTIMLATFALTVIVRHHRRGRGRARAGEPVLHLSRVEPDPRRADPPARRRGDARRRQPRRGVAAVRFAVLRLRGKLEALADHFERRAPACWCSRCTR